MKHMTSIMTIVLPIAALSLFVLQIVYTNNLAQDGATLKAISSKSDILASENERLEEKIASASSLMIVQEKANALGFIPAKQFLTLSQGKYLVSLSKKR